MKPSSSSRSVALVRRVCAVAALCALSTCALPACGLAGNGVAKQEKRTWEPVDQIVIEKQAEFTIEVGDGPPELVVSGDENLLPYVLTEVVDGRLVIVNNIQLRPELPLHVLIITPKLAKLELSGTASGRVLGARGPSLTVGLAGAAAVELQGEVSAVTFDISGTGAVAAHGLRAQSVKIDLSGAGSAKVFATAELDVKISGAGAIEYAGKPAKISKTISGVGMLKAIDP